MTFNFNTLFLSKPAVRIATRRTEWRLLQFLYDFAKSTGKWWRHRREPDRVPGYI